MSQDALNAKLGNVQQLEEENEALRAMLKLVGLSLLFCSAFRCRCSCVKCSLCQARAKVTRLRQEQQIACEKQFEQKCELDSMRVVNG